MANAGHFIWYELTTTDAAAAKAFYSSVVGWGTRDASTPGSDYTLFTAGDVAAGGLIGLSDDARRMGAQPRWTGYVGVDDVDAAVGKLTRLGGTVYVPPTDIPDVSRFAVVADAQRATFALLKWQHADQQQTAATLPGVVAWHELLAANTQRAFDFYRELLGWQKADGAADASAIYQLFAVSGQTVGSITIKPPRTPLPFWLYYFYVADVDAAAARVKAGGGQILEGPVEAAGGSRIACCLDPQGAMFALSGQGRKIQGYFAPALATDPGATRRYVPKPSGA